MRCSSSPTGTTRSGRKHPLRLRFGRAGVGHPHAASCCRRSPCAVDRAGTRHRLRSARPPPDDERQRLLRHRDRELPVRDAARVDPGRRARPRRTARRRPRRALDAALDRPRPCRAVAAGGDRPTPRRTAPTSTSMSNRPRRCVERGLLHDDASGVLEFNHELARLAIADALSPGARQRLPRGVLSALWSEPVVRADPARLAFHAAEAGDADAVIRYARWPPKASALGAHREAAVHLANALGQRARMPQPSVPDCTACYGDELVMLGRTRRPSTPTTPPSRSTPPTATSSRRRGRW